MVSLSTAESEQDAAVKTASGRRDPACGEGFGHGVCGLNLHLDTSATMCPVNRGGLGKAKHVDMQNSWIQEEFKAGKIVTKKVGTNVNPADLMTKPLRRPKMEQLVEIVFYRFVEQVQWASCKTDVFSANCRMKFDHGVLAVGCSTVSGTDNWMVRNSLQKCLKSRPTRTRGGVC